MPRIALPFRHFLSPLDFFDNSDFLVLKKKTSGSLLPVGTKIKKKMRRSLSLAADSDDSSSGGPRNVGGEGRDDWQPGYDREVWVSSSEELPTFDPVRAREAFSMMPGISSPILPNGPGVSVLIESKPLSFMMSHSGDEQDEEDVEYIGSSEPTPKKRVLPEFMQSGWKRPVEEKKARRSKKKQVRDAPPETAKSVEELLEECLERERKRDAIWEMDRARLEQERDILEKERRRFEEDKDAFLRRMMIRTAMYARSSAESSSKESFPKDVQRQAARNFFVLASNPDEMMDRFATDVRYPNSTLLEQEKSSVTKILAGSK